VAHVTAEKNGPARVLFAGHDTPSIPNRTLIPRDTEPLQAGPPKGGGSRGNTASTARWLTPTRFAHIGEGKATAGGTGAASSLKKRFPQDVCSAIRSVCRCRRRLRRRRWCRVGPAQRDSRPPIRWG
jgi:hypothetical protein